MFSSKKRWTCAGLITRRTALQLGGAAAAFGLGPNIARADTYPDGPISVIIPLLPGAACWTRVCTCGQRRIPKGFETSRLLLKTFRARPAILVRRASRANSGRKNCASHTSAPVSTNPFVIKDMPLTLDKDLLPVILTAVAPIVLTVHKSFPATNVQEYRLCQGASWRSGLWYVRRVRLTTPRVESIWPLLAGVKLNFTFPIRAVRTLQPTSLPATFHPRSPLWPLCLNRPRPAMSEFWLSPTINDHRAFPDIATIEVGDGSRNSFYAPAAWNAMFVPGEDARTRSSPRSTRK